MPFITEITKMHPSTSGKRELEPQVEHSTGGSKSGRTVTRTPNSLAPPIILRQRAQSSGTVPRSDDITNRLVSSTTEETAPKQSLKTEQQQHSSTIFPSDEELDKKDEKELMELATKTVKQYKEAFIAQEKETLHKMALNVLTRFLEECNADPKDAAPLKKRLTHVMGALLPEQKVEITITIQGQTYKLVPPDKSLSEEKLREYLKIAGDAASSWENQETSWEQLPTVNISRVGGNKTDSNSKTKQLLDNVNKVYGRLQKIGQEASKKYLPDEIEKIHSDPIVITYQHEYEQEKASSNSKQETKRSKNAEFKRNISAK